MAYLTIKQLEEIASDVEWISIQDIEDISQYSFDSGIEEYNVFLFEGAKEYENQNISRTHLLLHKTSQEIIGYMTLSCDSIPLSRREKVQTDMGNITFIALPALKVGKLAISNADKFKRKGYGSFLIEMAKATALELNNQGIACRFLTVDADIEYDQRTITFYEKNGFIINQKVLADRRQSLKGDNVDLKTISMRLDINVQEYE